MATAPQIVENNLSELRDEIIARHDVTARQFAHCVDIFYHRLTDQWDAAASFVQVGVQISKLRFSGCD